jgi:hypothetical protein
MEINLETSMNKVKTAMINNTPADSFNIAGRALTTAVLAAISLVQKVLTFVGSSLVIIGEISRVVISGLGALIVKLGEIPLPDFNKPVKQEEVQPEPITMNEASTRVA